MKCGVPVICNNSSNLKAVVADAGMLIDTENTEEMCKAIIKILADSGLQKRMSEKELEQAAQFSWKKAAEETVKVYEKMRKP